MRRGTSHEPLSRVWNSRCTGAGNERLVCVLAPYSHSPLFCSFALCCVGLFFFPACEQPVLCDVRLGSSGGGGRAVGLLDCLKGGGRAAILTVSWVWSALLDCKFKATADLRFAELLVLWLIRVQLNNDVKIVSMSQFIVNFFYLSSFNPT